MFYVYRMRLQIKAHNKVCKTGMQEYFPHTLPSNPLNVILVSIPIIFCSILLLQDNRYN
jgi:hypothetical protein